MKKIDELEEQIKSKSKDIYTDSYAMSVGEIASMYDDYEIILQPDYQRFFRWSNSQKTSFIESLLLGIPIPPIFIYQQEDGVWAVIDGLQRLSTILQFMGKLRDDHNSGHTVSELSLESTRFLPALKGKTFDGESGISNRLKLFFKRAKLDLKIIGHNNDPDTQYELFQRLNTGGTNLSNQEVRNAIILMENREAFYKIEEMSKNNYFDNTLPLSKKQLDEKYNFEYIVRYFIYRFNIKSGLDIRGNEDINPFLTQEIIRILRNEDINWNYEESIFNYVFKELNKALGENAFKKYDKETNEFKGAVLLKQYEAIVPGLINSVIHLLEQDADVNFHNLKEKIKDLSLDETFIEKKDQHRPILRMKELLLFSVSYFDEYY